jgi:hypothetical protein
MDSALRPREIQTRIRSGETPETVAAAAGMPVDRIMPFAGPVMAERAHVADRAQRSSLRRVTSEGALARTLGEAVAGRLRAVNVPPDAVEWDSWRREDGRWTLTGSFDAGERAGTARFAFDGPGNFVTSENDEARWLVGDAEPRPAVAPAPRLVPVEVPEEDVPLGEDVLEMVKEGSAPEPEDSTVDLSEATEGLRETAPRRAVRKTRGRASVPSWDEIMFGGSGD